MIINGYTDRLFEILASAEANYDKAESANSKFNAQKQRLFNEMDSLFSYIKQHIDKRRGFDSTNILFKFQGSKSISEFVEMLNRIERIKLNGSDEESAYNICKICQTIVNKDFIPLRMNDKELNDRIDLVVVEFELLQLTFDEVFNDNAASLDSNQHFSKNNDRAVKADQYIIESLVSYILLFILECKEYSTISQILMNTSKFLDHSLQPHGGILPNDILEVLSRLPRPVYQGILYFLSLKMNIEDKVYYNLISSIHHSNLDVFSQAVFEQDLYFELSKYYDLIALAVSLNNQLNRTYPLYHRFNPDEFVQRVRVFFIHRFFNDDDPVRLNRVIAATVVSVFNEIKNYGTFDALRIVSQFMEKDDVVKERISIYERLKWYSAPSSASDNSNSQITENSSVKLQSTQNGDTPTMEPPILNKEFNCIISENEIDSFLEYLVWRGYLKEGDQASFKYDVFGGYEPTDYRDVSFNDNPLIVGSTMLGVIIWKLRKENDDPVRLYNKKVTQSNSQIGIGKESMRIFVDFGLFFPSLINTLVMKDSKAHEHIKKRLKERVQDLSGSDEYKNCSSILEFIQQHEKKDRQYWVVSKKIDD